MNIFSIGLNHKTASVGIRERFYLQPLERGLILSESKNDPHVIEAFVLSTCNRIEIYALTFDYSPDDILKILLKVKNIRPEASLEKYFYSYSGLQAVEHLMKVAAGLDSLILGEKQILGQIKGAMELSRSMGMMGRTFNILSNMVLRAAQKSRSETAIDMEHHREQCKICG